MQKFFYSLLVLASVSLFSCAPQTEAQITPKGPQPTESSMPHNRPMGPEGAGALGILNQR